MQIKIALSYLLRNFEFRPDPSMSYNMTYTNGVTLGFKDDVLLKVKRLNEE